MNTEALAAFATKDAARRAAAPKWRPPEMTDFHYDPFWGRDVVAVDPSLRAFGAVFLTISSVKDQSPHVRVHAARKFTSAEGDATGWEANFQRAMQVGHDFRLWLSEDVFAGHARIRLEIVHEQPPTGGGRIIRPEATILGGFATRIAARDIGVLTQRMVAPLSHKNLFCGPRKPGEKGVTKAEHHAALKETAGRLGISGMDLITNEATRDALSIGLLHLTRPPLEAR